MSLRVLIAGAGLGGLALAQALRQQGLQPLVFERGPAAIDVSSSYRIHIDAAGSRALHACLPPALWTEFEQHAAAAPRGLEFVTEHLRHLTFIAEENGRTRASAARQAQPDPVAQAHPISRSGLRKLLLSGLEDVVTFDRRVESYELPSGNQVVVHFADGGSASGDVLVGADGSASAIRKQLLPQARVVDSGVGGIAGKVYFDAPMLQRLDPRLLTQMTMVLPRGGMAMFVAPFRRRDGAAALDLPEHLFWVVIGPTPSFGPDLRAAGAEQLRERALARASGWHPLLVELVRAAAAESLVGIPLHTAEPVGAWAPGPVTLLGDAIHTMTPLQGLGGNTALVDAANLSRQLVLASRGQRPLAEAIGTYEAAMRQYGFQAVAQSLRVSNSIASTNPAARLAFRGVLSTADRLPWLRRAMFARRELAVGELQPAA